MRRTHKKEIAKCKQLYPVIILFKVFLSVRRIVTQYTLPPGDKSKGIESNEAVFFLKVLDYQSGIIL
jgi:hypothetical protein